MSGLKKRGRAVRLMIKIVLPLCLILAGVSGWNYFKAQEPKMKRKPPEKQAAVVETISMEPGNYQSSVMVMGTVMPDRKIILKSKVAGEVVAISKKFVQGGLIKKGETLLTLDDSDYRIEVLKARSAFDKALSDLAIEKGSQMIAKEELKLINQASQGELKATDLALRKPQLVKAKAAVDSAGADLEKAQLNLSRTKVIVPFNALILEKQVNLGSLVTIQGVLATLVDVDAYLVEALVPPDRLASIMIGETTGSRAIIQSQYSNQTWQGRVVRTTGKITGKSRMAGVIILVSDPLGLNRRENIPQLLLDDHVNVRIMGELFENVFSMPRSVLRDNNTVWVINSGILEIKEITLAWKEDGRVFVKSGIRAGDTVITSDLPAPVKGMALQQSSGDRS
ncbi:efflux RND transporter periplasmic adaptor subunit [Desulfobacula toluolica]|uniref:RND efflux system, membrane fusion protein (MFP) n=1 Tax=Desulfobacula toluolica (strain DSM 7467 / Tol2) TaxID=651182 RepID=K0NKD8_DESTT|nr:efflux RND transporter periplasmic adaptor subunit [Desulfobacula toluolica]CCK79247.1 RND efflux system, membrane fusion protein (MFP) [Desulfobacula toluolica Tol2]